MSYKFKAYGHQNITSRHKTTLEFTKDKDLSLKGDCIIGVGADFSLKELKEFIKSLKSKKIKIIIEINVKKSMLNKPLLKKSLKKEINKKIKEVVIAEINPDFDSEREIVVRKSDFKDKRTFAVRADKSSKDLSREFVDCLGEGEQEIGVVIEGEKE